MRVAAAVSGGLQHAKVLKRPEIHTRRCQTTSSRKNCTVFGYIEFGGIVVWTTGWVDIVLRFLVLRLGVKVTGLDTDYSWTGRSDFEGDGGLVE